MIPKVIQKDEDITVELVNSLLKDSGFKPITKVTIIPFDYQSPMCDIKRIALEYDETKEGDNSKTLILKFARVLPQEHWISILAAIDRTYLREVSTYIFLAQKYPSIVPKVYYYSFFPQTNKYTLVLEDLHGPYEQLHQIKGIDPGVAEAAVQQIAKFHATFTNNKDIETSFQPYSKFFSNVKSFSPVNILCEQFMGRVQTVVQTQLTNLFQTLSKVSLTGSCLEKSHLQELLKTVDLKQFLARHKEMLTMILNFDKAPIRSLIHCDLRAENLFFSKNGIKIIDWKYGLIGSPVVDILRFITQNLTIDNRRKFQKELLNKYVAEFQKSSNLKLSEEYIKQSMLAYIMIEVHFVGSTLNFLTNIDLSHFNEVAEQKVVEYGLTLLERSLCLYVDHFK